MADIVTSYVLTTPGPDITFNAGTMGDGTDKYWLNRVGGLDGPTLRTPFDLVPFGDGAVAHTTRRGPLYPILDGMYLIESSTSQAACQELRNALHFNLKAALESILAPNAGTLDWTAAGQGALSLPVFYWVTLDAPYTDNFMVQNFSFGLFSEDPAP